MITYTILGPPSYNSSITYPDPKRFCGPGLIFWLQGFEALAFQGSGLCGLLPSAATVKFFFLV